MSIELKLFNDNLGTHYHYTQYLAELCWRIAKLEHVEYGIGRMQLVLGSEEEFLNRSQSSQFFLGGSLSHVVNGKKDSIIEEDIEGQGYKNK
jgi:hypothetical protein